MPLTASEATGRRQAIADIVTVIAATAVGYAVELAAADHVPWGEEARGVLAVFGGVLAAIWLTLARGRTMADLGFRRPARWGTVPFWVIGIFVVFVAAQVLGPVLLAPVFDLPQPDFSRYDVIRGNLPAALAAALVLPLTAAVPEEIIYRGFLIERVEALVGRGRWRAAIAVVAQSLLFGAVHFQWGAGGILLATIMGLIWGAAFVLCGRNLWIVIMAHSTGHVALVASLYLSPAQG